MFFCPKRLSAQGIDFNFKIIQMSDRIHIGFRDTHLDLDTVNLNNFRHRISGTQILAFFDKKTVDDSAQRGADDTSLQIQGSVCHGGLEVLHPCKSFIKSGLGR